MNRLQKKCVIATVGFHLLLLVILFVGPAFFNSEPKPDDSQVLDMIPLNLVDAALNSGVKGAQPPPPAPQPTFVRSIVNFFEPAPKPEPAIPAPVTTPNQPHKIQVDLHPVVRNPSNNSATVKPKDNSSPTKNLATELRTKLSTATQIDVPGDSSAAYANYAGVVKSIYEQAWTPPDDAQNDDANTKVSVTIASDGTVINARIVTPSGDEGVDATVQHTLERVTTIRPFPEGSTDKERTYIINFNLKAKRMLE